MKKLIQLGTQQVRKNGNALAINLPNRWLTEHRLTVGDPLFSILTIDGEIRVHLKEVEWSKKAKVRQAASRGSAYLTLSAGHAKELGIEDGTPVKLIADAQTGVLSVRRAA